MSIESGEPADWPEHLPGAFYQALEELNRGEYFLCHETLEALWIPEKRTVRELYQGVIQIAVGCYHLTVRANWVGAVNKLEAGARRLERALKDPSPELYGVKWKSLIQEVDRLLDHLRLLNRDRISEYDRSLLPQARYGRPEDSR